jgi:hypothetical protein
LSEWEARSGKPESLTLRSVDRLHEPVIAELSEDGSDDLFVDSNVDGELAGCVSPRMTRCEMREKTLLFRTRLYGIGLYR